jgi:mannose-6-phosphate isomerase-like protein (cupin superfamily)
MTDVANKGTVTAIESKGRRFWPLLASANGDLVVIEMEAGTATNRHWHAKTEEFFYVVEGEGTLKTEQRGRPDDARPIRAGDAFLIALGTAHQIFASTRMTILKFDTPGFDPRDAHTETLP